MRVSLSYSPASPHDLLPPVPSSCARYKVEVVELNEHGMMSGRRRRSPSYFSNDSGDGRPKYPGLDLDGVVAPGTKLNYGDPYYAQKDSETGDIKLTCSKHKEVSSAEGGGFFFVGLCGIYFAWI